MRTLLEIVQSTHTDQWLERHANGEVPDCLPYGFNKLERHGIKPVWPSRKDGWIAIAAKITAKLTSVRCVEGWHTPIDGIEARLCWDERTGIPAAVDRRTRHLPVVSGVIWATAPDAPARIRALLKCAFHPRSHALFALSNAQVSRLRTMTAAPVEYIPFGIDADFWTQSGVSESNQRLVVSAGNDRHRDFDMLTRAVLSHPDNRLAIATSRLIIGNDRLLAEPLSHTGLRELYQRGRVVAVATKQNDHCSGITAVLEAMACARPVVASANPGMDDYIQHGVTGLLVPPNDADALAKAINSLLDDPDRAHVMGVAAAANVRNRFTTDHMASRLAELLWKAAAN
jgi:glycosyltransferase involved in cell wall biosynthesis